MRAYLATDQDLLFGQFAQQLMTPLAKMSNMLTMMSIQCIDFSSYSPSTVVMASLYASTAFVKHSKSYRGDLTNKWVALIRKFIFDIMNDEIADRQQAFNEQHKQMPEVSKTDMQLYLNQHSTEFVEQIAMNLVDFYKMFDTWHCGLNQLKKFNTIPFE